MRYFFVAAIAVILAGCTTGPLTEENAKVLASTCENGVTFYNSITAAAATGVVTPRLKDQADQLYAVLDTLCKKGSMATQADILLAGAQVFALTKIWRDAS